MIATVGPSALWYLTRGAGAVSLVLLTASLVLGVVHTERRRPVGAPRMLVESAHRTISLLVVAVLAIHIGTSLLDSYAPIHLLDAVIPFVSAYRPLWVGFGALAFDMLLALTVTSVLRVRLGFRAWRAVHWLAYACWPVAVVHGIGTGSDARTTWMLALTAVCVLAVLGALAGRLASGGADHRAIRGWALAATALSVLAFVVWLPLGPLGSDWARRSGTPARLLSSSTPRRTAVASRSARAQPASARGFSSPVSGSVRRGVTSDGLNVVDISLHLQSGSNALRVRLAGQPLEGGGVSMTSSAVSLEHGATYQGRIQSLAGSTLEALVGTPDGRALRLRLRLSLNGGTATGDVAAVPVTGGQPPASGDEG